MLEVNYHKTKLKDFVGRFPNEIVVVEPNEERIFLWPDLYEKELKKYHKEYLLDYVITLIKSSEYADYWLVRVEEEGTEYCDWKESYHSFANNTIEINCKSRSKTVAILPKQVSYCNFKYCPYCGREIKWVD